MQQILFGEILSCTRCMDVQVCAGCGKVLLRPGQTHSLQIEFYILTS